MVLLENFGAGLFTVKLGWSNSNNVACLLPRNVAQPMMPGIPKFRKESLPERAGTFYPLNMRPRGETRETSGLSIDI